MGITRARLRFPSPALIVACLALFAALGGGAYAARLSSTASLHWTKAKLKDNWKRFSNVVAPPSYAEDSSGVVHLRGGISGGAPFGAAFILPKRMRPSHELFIAVYTESNTTGSVQITPKGLVVVSGSNSTTFASLDGVSFAAGE
jgi:hypothetical protein